MTSAPDEDATTAYGLHQWIGLFAGPALFLLALFAPAPAGLPPEAMRVVAITLWVAIWWVTEPIALPATSLLPLILLPITGVTSAAEAASGYADPLIYVFVGGFMVAMALEHWGLHRRIGMWIISLVGCSPSRIVLGFMVATGFISMWMSNTATAMMMMPMGVAIVHQLVDLLRQQGDDGSPERRRDIANLGTAIVLGVAYAASIGGVGTLVGSPPNIIFAGNAQKLLGVEISFAGWMLLGVPLAFLGLVLGWLYIARVALPVSAMPVPGALDTIRRDLRALGPMSGPEQAVLTVFCLMACAWVSRQWLITPVLPKVDDAVIAITGALLLFLIPANKERTQFVLDWGIAKKIPWGIALLFGGGLTISNGFEATGLSAWLGGALGGLAGFPPLLAVVAVVAAVCFLSEVTSNSAIATLFLPLMLPIATALRVDPLLLMIAATLACSWAFMLPAGTPPNAIAYGTGLVNIKQMVRVGFALNLGSILIIAAVAYWIVPFLW